MKRTLILIAGVLLLASCAPNREKQLKAIEEREAALSTLDMITEDSQLSELRDLYLQFVSDFPDDSLAALYMTKAAEKCISISDYGRAIDLLDSVITLYPDYEDVGGCWFQKGYAYEAAEEYDSARAIYSSFVEHYPDHVMTRDTRSMLERNLIGLSPEEQLERILSESERQ